MTLTPTSSHKPVLLSENGVGEVGSPPTAGNMNCSKPAASPGMRSVALLLMVVEVDPPESSRHCRETQPPTGPLVRIARSSTSGEKQA